MKCQLLVPAAGLGTRLGQARPKALLELAGKPLLVHTLERFASLDLVRNAVIAVPPGRQRDVAAAVQAAFPNVAFTFVEGGAERQISVSNGLDRLDPATAIVVIHDAARPFVAESSIAASIEAAADCGAATVAIPCIDTILQADADRFLQDTPDRAWLWACQTPQTFRVDVIRAAHIWARDHGFAGTDDATLVRRAGGKVRLVEGTPLNLKVTTPADMALAELIIERDLA